MTTTVASVIATLATKLQDLTYARWTQDILLQCINETQKEMVLYKPNIGTKNVSIQLVAGPKQSIPNDGISLVSVLRNTGTAGTTNGAPIRLVSKKHMDVGSSWYAAKTESEVREYVYDMNDQKNFYVYPPASGYVEIIYVAEPPVMLLTDTVWVDDAYVPILVRGAIAQAYAIDAESQSNAALAMTNYQAFMSMLGVKSVAEQSVDPNNRKG